MADYKLSYAGAEIDKRLASATVGAKWHELKSNITNSTDFTVGDFLINTSTGALLVGSPAAYMPPGAVYAVATVNEQGVFSVDNSIALTSNVPNIITAYESTVNTNTYPHNTVVLLNNSVNQTVLLTASYFDGAYQPDGRMLFFVAGGTGIKTFAGDTNMTVYSVNGKKQISGQYGMATAFYRGYSQWYLSGDLI